MTMYTKILSVVAAVLLVAACESGPDKGAVGAGAGNAGAENIVPGSQRDLEVNVGDRVFFDYDRYTLTPEGRATLDRQIAWLKKYPSVTVTVEGHADERGTREYNLALGERRANAARSYLQAQGVPANRMKTISYGKERPAVEGSNEQAWAQNRRAVTVVD
jgi:peptidoglycan-associated lipoprotein